MSSPSRKERMLAAAQALFSAKGYHATTIRDIAHESGILSGSLYAHIQSKEDLLIAIVQRGAEQFVGRVEPIAYGPGSAESKLRRALAAHIDLVATSIDAATVFFHEWKALGPENRAIAQVGRARYEQLWSDMIADGVASGEFRPVDQKFARLLVMSAANWLYQWYDPAGPLTPDAVANRFADLILQALRADPPANDRELA